MGKSLSVTLGCDPEVFCRPKGKKQIVAAAGLIPGTKYDPHNVLDGMVQVDGCALEFGITPAKHQGEWTTRIQSVMGQLEAMIPDHELVIEPVATFEPKYWEKKVPDSAKELGCEPDWNAWTGEVNPRPDTSANPTLRSAGGHIHVGWCKGKDPFDKNHFEDCRLVAKQMDYYLGMFSLLWDKDGTRRKLYGAAGSFRPKPYGCEYRPLSNQWLKTRGLMDWVYYYSRKAITDLSEGNSQEKLYGDSARKIIDANQLDWQTSSAINYGYVPHNYMTKFMQRKDTQGPIWMDR